MSDEESDDEESSSNDYNDYSESFCFFISMLWIERDKYINTNFPVTAWMLCVISHIKVFVFKSKKYKSYESDKYCYRDLVW